MHHSGNVKYFTLGFLFEVTPKAHGVGANFCRLPDFKAYPEFIEERGWEPENYKRT